MNNQEIEFKYKVNKIPEIYLSKKEITQVYFDGLKKCDILNNIFPNNDLSIINTYRVRKINENDNVSYIITLKSKAIGLKRIELEKEITLDLFNILIENNELSTIIKNRYILKENKYTFEFDEYLNLKEKLFTCEVELESENNLDKEKEKIEDIFINVFKIEYLDVTYDNRYKNSNLVKYFS